MPSVCAIMTARVFVAAGSLKLRHVDLVGRQRDIDEYRHQAILDDRIDGRGKTRGDRDDFVAGLRRRSPSLGEVSAVSATRLADEPELTREARADADKPRQFALEILGKAACREPAVQAESTTALDRGVDYLAGNRNRRLAGNELL